MSMRFAIWMPILLRFGSALVFVIAVIVAGAANRSALMVPMLAAVAKLAHLNTPRMTINFIGKEQQTNLIIVLNSRKGQRSCNFGKGISFKLLGRSEEL